MLNEIRTPADERLAEIAALAAHVLYTEDADTYNIWCDECDKQEQWDSDGMDDTDTLAEAVYDMGWRTIEECALCPTCQC